MGLPLACTFASRGAFVVVCDRDQSIVESINEGIDPHQEPEQDRYVRDCVAAGRLRASADTAAEVANADAVVVLVSAMLTGKGDIDWGNLADRKSVV